MAEGAIERFVAAMTEVVPEEARIMMCHFRGDPGQPSKGRWRAHVLNSTGQMDPKANVYLCVSAMKRNERGEFRRRKENFAGGLLLMIDDLGTGPAAKFPLSTIDPLPPTAMVETSPDNFQAIYMFREAVEDLNTFQALIRAFIARQFLGDDPGMAGVNRVFRPPFGVNGKPKHSGWEVRLGDWAPDRRYSVDDLVRAFGLVLKREGPAIPRGATVDRAVSIRAFIGVRAALRSAGMLKSEDPDMAGWADVHCPWTDGHTGQVDNGAAIRIPDAENAWQGAFKCHHGSCAERGWRDLTDWLAAEQEGVLTLINANAPEELF